MKSMTTMSFFTDGKTYYSLCPPLTLELSSLPPLTKILNETLDLKEFNRLLKGRFYQALLPKWQRKLGAPKAAESFEDLFARARTFERHEQQFSANSASRSDTGQKGEKKRNKDESQSKPQASNEPKSEAATSQSSGGPKKRRGECYNCHERGHIAKYCPRAKESPGRSNSSNVSMLTTEVLENLSGTDIG